MVRILFTTYPAFGHLHPVVPLALAAQAADHDIRVATGPNLTDWVGQCGLVGERVGLSEDEAATVADREFAGPDRTGRMFCDVWVSSALPDLLKLTSAWHPDLVVHEEEEYAGVLLSELIGVPCVTQSWSAPARPAKGRAFAQEALAPIWRRWVEAEPARRTGQLYLDACPPPFQTGEIQEIGRTARVVNVRPGLFDGPPTTAPAAIVNLAQPAVYISLGTVAVFSQPELLRRLALALSPLFASVVVAAGPNPVSALGDLPANVYAFGYVPQSLVLPAVNLLVSHGGAGGTIGALVHGLPHLVLPGHGESQISNGEAVQRIGAGLRLRPDQRSDAQIESASRRLMEEPSFAAVAHQVRDELNDLPDAGAVLDQIEREAAS